MFEVIIVWMTYLFKYKQLAYKIIYTKKKKDFLFYKNFAQVKLGK